MADVADRVTGGITAEADARPTVTRS